MTILGSPTDIDRQVHRYLFQRLLTHAFTDEQISLHPGFLEGAKNEIVNAVVSYAAMANPAKKRLKPAEREVEQARVTRVADQIKTKLENGERPILSQEELSLLQEALENRSSICVESVISRHNKSHLVVPISFSPTRPDMIKIEGEEVRIGPRGVIPPCDRYCQLFSGSHLLWADLLRKPSLDQLEKMALESGQHGLKHWFDKAIQNR